MRTHSRGNAAACSNGCNRYRNEHCNIDIDADSTDDTGK